MAMKPREANKAYVKDYLLRFLREDNKLTFTCVSFLPYKNDLYLG